MDHMERTYQAVDEETALFNGEYYLTVWKCPVEGLDADGRDRLFQVLYAFEHPDMEMEIDISEEAKGMWYLQLLVPAMLTPADTAKKRLARGIQALSAHLADHGAALPPAPLLGEEIYRYVKRYNPAIRLVTP